MDHRLLLDRFADLLEKKEALSGAELDEILSTLGKTVSTK
jgi:hypothetical protein